MSTGISVREWTSRTALAFLLLAWTGQSLAAGFYLSSVGTPRSTGTAGVLNVTNNTGPDSAWANPAGLTGIKSPVIVAGTTVIAPFAEWDAGISEAGGVEGTNTGDPALAPALFYAQPLTDKWSFGFGFSALQGGGVDYGDAFVGRYSATEVLLQGVGATWSFGYKATDKLSLGFGGSVVYTQFDQKIAINQGAIVAGAPDAKVEFKDLDDIGIQPIVGLQYAITPNLLFGMSFRDEFDAELEGNIRFKNLAAGVPLPRGGSLEVDWTNPRWLEAGLAWKAGERRFIAIAGNWQEWSEFSDNTLGIDLTGAAVNSVILDRQFDDTWGIGVSFGRQEYDPALADVNSSGWAFGVSYETSPVSDGKRTADLPFDESWRVAAVYFRNRPQTWDWSVSGTLQYVGDARLDQTAQGARFTGEFDPFIVLYLSGTIRFDN
jgi:long-chain fatty acid transport protein